MRLRQDRATRWQQVPDGYRDLGPAEAERRSALASRLREQFARWGYREVVTPTLEFLETIVHGTGPGIEDQLVKVIDGAAVLALRPEMTVPIARLAAMRLLRSAAGPLRLCYVAPVFRSQERGLGRLREFTQAGVELLGAPSPDGDAEVIALAVESLRAAGVPGTTIRLGHLGLLNDLLQELPEGLQADVRARLYRREFVGIGNAALDGPPARLLRALPELHGLDGLERAREFATSPTSRGALRELEGVAEQLRAYGVADAVEIDLSVIRDFSYYTGIVFEAHGQGAGYPLLGGGRYDTLLARFDADCPATGFALGLERVLAAAPEEPVESRDVILAADERSRLQVVRLAADLRGAGLRVLVATGMDWPAVLRWAEARGVTKVVRVVSEEMWLYDATTRREGLITRNQLLTSLTPQSEPRVVAWSH